MVKLHSLAIGGVTLTDVPAALSEDETFLLGQSFLSKFKSWSIDNRRHVLTLHAS